MKAKVFNQTCVNCMVVNLTEKEDIALNAVKIGISEGWQTDEITEFVAEKLQSSLNTAKGYIGKLVQKGIIKKEVYTDYNLGKIIQFSLNK
jgi:hypothetical protein